MFRIILVIPILSFIILPLAFVAALGEKPLQLESNEGLEAIGQGNYAIIIGINDYESDDILDLKYSEADALEMYEVLTNICGYDPEHVYLYLDGVDDPPEAGRADIKSLKRRFYNLSNPDLYGDADTLLIYFSGHGANLSGNNYVIPVDGEVDPALVENFNINLDDLISWLENSKFKRQVLLIDPCRNQLTIGEVLGIRLLESKWPWNTGLVYASLWVPNSVNWGGWIRTIDTGSKGPCLTTWPRPSVNIDYKVHLKTRQ